MSIIEHTGSALDVEEGILVHGCNCLGAMGSGIAWAIRKKWPSVYNAYKYHEEQVGLHLGDIAATRLNPNAKLGVPYLAIDLPENLVVVNAMTQYYCGGDENVRYVDYDAITACFLRVKFLATALKLPVHFPLIGCGLANGKWEEVGPRIEAALGPDIEKHLWVLPQ